MQVPRHGPENTSVRVTTNVPLEKTSRLLHIQSHKRPNAHPWSLTAWLVALPRRNTNHQDTVNSAMAGDTSQATDRCDRSKAGWPFACTCACGVQAMVSCAGACMACGSTRTFKSRSALLSVLHTEATDRLPIGAYAHRMLASLPAHTKQRARSDLRRSVMQGTAPLPTRSRSRRQHQLTTSNLLFDSRPLEHRTSLRRTKVDTACNRRDVAAMHHIRPPLRCCALLLV
jgi:hypothetical protein